jgi:hypothetical protein
MKPTLLKPLPPLVLQVLQAFGPGARIPGLLRHASEEESYPLGPGPPDR